MTNVKNVICQDFENEKWLFVSEELTPTRMEHWKEHLLNCDSCASELREDLALMSEIKESNFADLHNASFNRIIDKATQKRKSRIRNIFSGGYKYSENKSIYGKAALIGVFSATAILISIITHQSIPDPVTKISRDLLDWEGKKIITQIDDLKTRVQMINDDKWGTEIDYLDRKLKQLENKSDKYSFN